MRRKVLSKVAMVVALAVPMFVFCFVPMAQASATSLDFDLSGIASGGMICYDGGSDPLVGTGIQVSQITAGSLLLPVTNGVLGFTSGANTGGWQFGSGGIITVTGDIGSGQELLLSRRVQFGSSNSIERHIFPSGNWRHQQHQQPRSHHSLRHAFRAVYGSPYRHPLGLRASGPVFYVREHAQW